MSPAGTATRRDFVKTMNTAARTYMGVDCPTFTNVDEMLDQTKPDLLMVTTVDGFHREYIVKGLDRRIDVMTEKPMTTDEVKSHDITESFGERTPVPVPKILAGQPIRIGDLVKL